MDNKSDFRIRAKSIRKTLDIAGISNEICCNIRNSDWYKNANNVLIFYPMKNEINLLTLLDDNKKFYLPKVNGLEMYICPFSKEDRLEISSLNIKEPCSNPVNPEVLDLVLVPALMVDKNNYRLGYGGGFYDRFLSENNLISVVPIAQKLVTEKLPIEDFDRKVDFVVTENPKK